MTPMTPSHHLEDVMSSCHLFTDTPLPHVTKYHIMAYLSPPTQVDDIIHEWPLTLRIISGTDNEDSRTGCLVSCTKIPQQYLCVTGL